MDKAEVEMRHSRSVKDFPYLHLESNEWVELVIERAKIRIILVWVAVFLTFIALTACMFFLLNFNGGAVFDQNMTLILSLFMLMICLVIFSVGLVSTKVHRDNKLYVTNKRLIHQSALALFSQSVNTIDLQSIEDVSFSKETIFDYILQIGTLKMTTVGDETTYTFKYVDTPRDEMQTITHLVYIEKEKTKETYEKEHGSNNF